MATAPETGYTRRRAWIAQYFDRQAAHHWAALTTDAPVSRIRQTVRAGRESMAATLLGWLPEDLSGARILDAGCGTGTLAIALAKRGATVVAVDLAGSLLDLARARAAEGTGRGRIEFHTGDMLDASLGEFDHVVAMDSLIHYHAADLVSALGQLAERTHDRMLVTFAPRTWALALMHAVGRLLPHGDHRAPAIEPIAERALRDRVGAHPALRGWSPGRSIRVSSGFYTSQAFELQRMPVPARANPATAGGMLQLNGRNG